MYSTLFLLAFFCSNNFELKAQTPTIDYFSLDGKDVVSMNGLQANSAFRGYSKVTGGELLFQDKSNQRGSKLIEITSKANLPALIIGEDNHVTFREDKIFNLQDIESDKTGSEGILSWSYSFPTEKEVAFVIWESDDGINFEKRIIFDELLKESSGRLEYRTTEKLERIWVRLEVVGNSGRSIYVSDDVLFNFGIMTVYPTISEQRVTVEFNRKQRNEKLVLTNANGIQVKVFNFSGKSMEIFIGDLPRGHYFLSSPNKPWIKTQRLVIL
jgi:hypothetical protein